MTEGDADTPQEPRDEGPPDRASMLARAILEISESLDIDTVVRRVVEEARGLTGARLGIIATVEESGAPGAYFFSGYTQEEQRELIAWPHALELFEHFREMDGPLRQEDFAGYAKELGLAPLASFPGAFQGTPMRHRGESVGYFFLGDKAGGAAFTDADEEMLVLFASQAAAAVANARAHRGEQRARMDLEALIETSPVGVLVFDGASGRMVSSNREARRIVEGLRTPGRAPEALPGTVMCRRADGREVPLAELPLALRSASTGTVRAEEVVLSAPDGRSVRTLVNATPTAAGGSGAGSVVVTLQDLAPLDEIERMRTEFLGLVSHELRTPLTAIKGSATTLLEEPAGLDRAEMREFHRVIVEQADRMRGLIADLLDTGRIESGTLSVTPEPTAVADLVEGARRAFLNGDGRHDIVVDLAGGLPPVMADRDRVVQVLNNLLANAARHTREAAVIRVAAAREGEHVAFSVADDGEGVAPELLPHLFRRNVGGTSGTASHGLGLAICKGLVEAHGGRIRAASDGPGQGTTIAFTIPVAAEPGAAAGRAPGADAREPPRILVVDDDARTLRFVRDALTNAGYAPLVTGAPDDLAGLIRAERPGAGAARPAAARARRDRAAAGGAGALRPAGDLHLRLRPRRDHRAGLRARRRRLHRQAVLADRAGGAHPRGAAPAPGPRDVRAGRARDRVREPHGHGERRGGRAHRHGVRAAAPALAQRRAGGAPRHHPAPRLGRPRRRRREPGAHLRAHAAGQARRQRRGPDLDLQPARGRLPHAAARRTLTRRHRPRLLRQAPAAPGSATVARSPPSARFASTMSPPWPRTMPRAMARPRPLPPVSRLREASIRTKGSNTRSSAASGNAERLLRIGPALRTRPRPAPSPGSDRPDKSHRLVHLAHIIRRTQFCRPKRRIV